MPDLIGSAVFQIAGDMSRLEQTLSQAQSRATQAASGISQALSSVGRGVRAEISVSTVGAETALSKVESTVNGINSALRGIRSGDINISTTNLSAQMAKIESMKAQLAAYQAEFAGVVARKPNAIAGVFGSSSYSYAEGTAYAQKYSNELASFNAKIQALYSEAGNLEAKHTAAVTADFQARLNAQRDWIVQRDRLNKLAFRQQYAAMEEEQILAEESLARYQAMCAKQIAARKDLARINRQEVALVGGQPGSFQPWMVGKSAEEIAAVTGGPTQPSAFVASARMAPYSGAIGGTGPLSAEMQAWKNATLAEHGRAVENINKSLESQIALEGFLDKASVGAMDRKARELEKMNKLYKETRLQIESMHRAEIAALGADASLAQKKDLYTRQDAQLYQLSEAQKRWSNRISETYKEISLVERAMGRLTRALFAFAGIYAFIEVTRGFSILVGSAIEFNKTIESVRIGMSALFEAEGIFSRGGSILTGVDSLNAALKLSDDMIKKLQYDNLKTVATFEQLVKAYQSALAPGLAAGFNPEQIRQYSLAMVQAAAAMQLPLDMLAEELRSMLRGTITPRNTIIATNLGITNEDIRKYQGNAQGLFDFVMSRLEKFNSYGNLLQNSFAGLASNLKDVFSMMMGTAGKDYFEFVKGAMRGLINYLAIVDTDKKKLELRPEAIQSFKDFYDAVQIATTAVMALGAAGYFVLSGLGTIGRKLSEIFKPLESDMDRLNYISKKMEEISRNKRKISPEEELGRYAFSETGMVVESVSSKPSGISDQTYIDNIKTYKSEYEKLNNILENNGVLNEQQTKSIRNNLSIMYDSEQAIAKYINKINEATMSSDGLHSKSMDVGIGLNTVAYNANAAARGMEDFVKWLKEAKSIRVGFAVSKDFQDEIEAVKTSISALQAGAPGTEAHIRRRGALELLKIQKAYEESMTGQGETMGGDPQYWRKKRIEREALTELQVQESQLSKKPSSAQPTHFMERMDRFERDVRAITQKASDAWDTYWIELADYSGNYYAAEELKMNKWYKDQLFSATEQSRKIWEEIYQIQEDKMNKKKLAPGTDERLAELYNRLPAVQEAENKIKDSLKAQLYLKQQMNTGIIKEAEEAAKLDQEYAKLTGSLQEQLYWENQLAALAAEREKKEKPTLAARIERNRQIAEQRRNNLQGDSFLKGFGQAAQDAYNKLPQLGALGSQAFESLTSSINNAADALAEFTVTGEMNFGNFVQSVVKDMVKMMYQWSLTQMFMGGESVGQTGVGGILGMVLKGLGFMAPMAYEQSLFTGVGTPVNSFNLSDWFFNKHTGSKSGVMRSVPISAFFGAPRLHNGLNFDEFPAILQKGETVIPKGESAGSEPNVSVNLVNNTSEKMREPEVDVKKQGNNYVLNVVLHGLKSNARFNNQMKAYLGQ